MLLLFEKIILTYLGYIKMFLDSFLFFPFFCEFSILVLCFFYLIWCCFQDRKSWKVLKSYYKIKRFLFIIFLFSFYVVFIPQNFNFPIFNLGTEIIDYFAECILSMPEEIVIFSASALQHFGYHFVIFCNYVEIILNIIIAALSNIINDSIIEIYDNFITELFFIFTWNLYFLKYFVGTFMYIDFFNLNIKCLLFFICFFSFTLFQNFIVRYFLFWLSIYEFPFLFLGAILFLILLVSTFDLLIMSLCIIGMSICLYALFAINSVFGQLAREACLKYFILSALSSGLILGGIKEIFINCGTLHFSLVNNFLVFKILDFSNYNELFAIKVGIFLIFSGFLFKLSAAPSHFWAPEVYAGIPFAIMSFVILPLKVAIGCIFLRMLKGIFFISFLNSNLNQLLCFELEFLILFVCLCSIIVGGIHAIFEQNIKRFLAYSSVNQIGFLLIGLLGFNSSIYGAQAFLYFIYVYVLNLFCLFTFIGILLAVEKTNIASKNYKTQTLQSYYSKTFNFVFLRDFQKLLNIIFDLGYFCKDKSISIINFTFSFFFILILFSLAGIPPLAGFFGKFYILLYAFKLKYWFLLFCGLIISIISAFYYLRLIKIIFFENNFLKNNDVYKLPNFYNFIFLKNKKFFFIQIINFITIIFFIIILCMLLLFFTLFDGVFITFVFNLAQSALIFNV
jgi:NADH-quinone oxidoreductase subunit N